MFQKSWKKNKLYYLKWKTRYHSKSFNFILSLLCWQQNVCQIKQRKFNFETFLLLGLMNSHLDWWTFPFTGSRICALLVANTNYPSFEVAETLRNHKADGVNSDNFSRASIFEFVSEPFSICGKFRFFRFIFLEVYFLILQTVFIWELSQSFPKSDVVWTAAIAIYLSSSWHEVNPHRNASRKRRSECRYSVKKSLSWIFLTPQSTFRYFWQRERIFYKIHKYKKRKIFAIPSRSCRTSSQVLTASWKVTESWEILKSQQTNSD